MKFLLKLRETHVCIPSLRLCKPRSPVLYLKHTNCYSSLSRLGQSSDSYLHASAQAKHVWDALESVPAMPQGMK